MRKQGIIKDVGKLVFSDPWYDKGVWCRFDTDLGSGEHIFDYRSKTDKYGVSFEFIIQRAAYGKGFGLGFGFGKQYGELMGVKGTSVSDEHVLGMDTACIYLGKEKYFKDVEISTGTDGEFGAVYELFDKEKKLIGVYCVGYVDNDFAIEESIYQTLKATFEVEEV